MARGGKIIAVLCAGELGARVGASLVEKGEVVITTLDGRGAATRRRCAESGMAVRSTIADIVREADIVLSLVPPATAMDVARDYGRLAHQAPPDALFVDLNSTGPALALEMCRTVEQGGRDFVDGAINGLASRFTDGGTLFLSGIRAGEIAALFEGVTRVQVLGSEPGAASAMKMLLSGISKGICALYAELALAAQQQGMLRELLDASSRIYPEVTNLVHRMLPTYPQHAGRRAEEMQQLERTVRDAGIHPLVTGAVRQFHDCLNDVELPANGARDIVELLEELAIKRFRSAGLRASPELATVNIPKD